MLYDRPPACVVMLAWQYRASIVANHQGYRKKGGIFLVPMPDVKRVGDA